MFIVCDMLLVENFVVKQNYVICLIDVVLLSFFPGCFLVFSFYFSLVAPFQIVLLSSDFSPILHLFPVFMCFLHHGKLGMRICYWKRGVRSLLCSM